MGRTFEAFEAYSKGNPLWSGAAHACRQFLVPTRPGKGSAHQASEKGLSHLRYAPQANSPYHQFAQKQALAKQPTLVTET